MMANSQGNDVGRKKIREPASDSHNILANRSGLRLQNISLLGLLAIVACVALGISHAITSLRLSRTIHELASLRKRLELIPVNDPNLIAARQLPSTDKDIRRWAVRLPGTSPKVLYANWGSSQLSDIQNIKEKSVHTFQLSPDPATQEAAIEFSIQRNPDDPKRGKLKIVTGDVSIISIAPEIVSLLTGNVPCSSESVGDVAVTRAASSPIKLFGTESSGTPKTAFCLWLDDPPPPVGK